MKKLLFLGVALITFTTATASYATTKANSVILSLDGGYEYFAPKRHLQNTAVGYGIVGYNFTNHWGIEGMAGTFTSYSRRNSNYDANIRGTIVAVDGVYHFTPCFQRIEPFVLAGVGAMHLSNNGPDADNEGNINAGIGAHIFANEVVALRLEARDLYTIVGGKNDVILAVGVTAFLNRCCT